MANILIDLARPIEDGVMVTFRAPCACNEVDGIRITYPVIQENEITTGTKDFTFSDAHGNVLTGIGNLFVEGVLVQAMLDVTKGTAVIMNADTNGYLTLTNILASGNMILQEGLHYGDSLPEAGTKGRIFFVKVGS